MRFENTPFYYDLIGHQFEIITGGTPSTKNKNYWKGDIPWMPSGDINKKYIFDVSKSISELGLTNSSAKMVPYHSVLIALAGQGKTRGTSAILEMNCCINQSLAAILPNIKFNPYYIFHYLESKYDDLRLISSGDGGRGGLNKELISNYKISYPTLPEQNKIADFFNKIDERIQAQIKIIEDCMSYRNAIVDYFFESLSSDWKQVRLSNILNEYSELHIKDNSIVHATLSKDGIFPKTDRYDRDFLVKDEDKKYKVSHLDDICYNPANLKFGVITRNIFGDCIISPIYITFKIKNGYLPKFIELLVTRKKFISKARKYEQGTVYERMAVNSSDLLSMHVLIPSFSMQQKIVNIINDIDNKISNEKKLLNLYKTQKSYLLKNMFV